jgi:hypothetical protein
MNNLKDEIKEVQPDDWKRIVNKGMWLAFATIITIMLMMTTCTMHSNTYDPARLREEAAIKQAETELATRELEAKKLGIQNEGEKTKAIERLVRSGVNPVAARCAIMGKSWKGNEDIACIIAASGGNPSIKDTKDSE